MKRWFLIVLSVVLLLSLTACSAEPEKTLDEKLKEQAKYTVSTYIEMTEHDVEQVYDFEYTIRQTAANTYSVSGTALVRSEYFGDVKIYDVDYAVEIRCEGNVLKEVVSKKIGKLKYNSTKTAVYVVTHNND